MNSDIFQSIKEKFNNNYHVISYYDVQYLINEVEELRNMLNSKDIRLNNKVNNTLLTVDILGDK